MSHNYDSAIDESRLVAADDPIDERRLKKPDAYAETAKSDSAPTNFAASVGGAMYGLPLAVRSVLGMDAPGEVQDWKRSMAGLWTTTAGKAGTLAGGVATALPAAFIPGANTAFGSAVVGGGFGFLQPRTEEDSALRDVMLGGFGGLLGKYGGELLGKGASKLADARNAKLAAAKEANSVRDSTIRAAQAAGYVLPPGSVRPNSPGITNRVLEGLSGKVQTQQAAAIKNQAVTNRLAAEEFGLPPDTPLTSATLDGIRKVAGKAYEQLKGIGRVTADDAFESEKNAAFAEYNAVKADFPELADGKMDALYKAIDRGEFNGSSLVELVKRLRRDGNKNINSQEPERIMLGRAQIGAQEALENMVERHLAATGNADFMQVFRNARTTIAKTYSVEKALEDSTGNVVAGKVGRQFSSGKPLTGNLETIGRTAEAFPRALQNMNSSMPGVTAADAMTAAIAGSAGGAGWAGLPLLRSPARAALLSGVWQRHAVTPRSYGPGLLGNAFDYAQSDQAKRIARLLGPASFMAPAEQ